MIGSRVNPSYWYEIAAFFGKSDKLISSSRCRGTTSRNTSVNHLVETCQVIAKLKQYLQGSDVDFLEVMIIMDFSANLRH